ILGHERGVHHRLRQRDRVPVQSRGVDRLPEQYRRVVEPLLVPREQSERIVRSKKILFHTEPQLEREPLLAQASRRGKVAELARCLAKTRERAGLAGGVVRRTGRIERCGPNVLRAVGRLAVDRVTQTQERIDRGSRPGGHPGLPRLACEEREADGGEQRAAAHQRVVNEWAPLLALLPSASRASTDQKYGVRDA